MQIIGLDINFSGRTGFCIGDAESHPFVGSIMGPEGDDERFFHHLQWLSLQLKEYEPDLLAYEAAYQGPNPNTTRLLWGMAAITQAVAFGRGVPTLSVNINSWRKAVLGKGSFPAEGNKTSGQIAKIVCVRKMKAMGFTPTNDDEAEAIGVWLFAQKARGNVSGANKLMIETRVA